MKTTQSMAAIAALLVTTLASAPALAWHHSRVRVGIGLHFGVPVGGYYYPAPYPYYYPPYYPYYAPAVVYRAPQAPVYVEQGMEAPAPQPQNSWYYCNDARAYYPYVKECPGGWQRVPAQPRG